MLPSIFISHGSPMLALTEAPARDFLRGLGASLPRPKAILVASAHWETREPAVNAVARNETIYDFGGFPRALYELTYNPPGDRQNHPAAEYHNTKPNYGMNEKDCIESIRAYHATTSFMDAQAGRVLAELDRLKLRDSTIVVFMSDHGYLLGQHEAWQKMMLFEETCRVPMIISWPGMKHRGETAEGLAESIDLYPTLAELAGLQGPKELQGKSMTPLLANPSGAFKPAVFTQLSHRQFSGRAVRTARWRYVEWNEGKAGVELYDHDADPREFKNLAKDPAYAQNVSELHQLLLGGGL